MEARQERRGPATASTSARDIAAIAAIFLATRLAMFAIATLVASNAELPPGVTHGLLGPLCRWDCGWYLGIAENGYSPHDDPGQPGATNFAFYPLYPLLVRIAAPLFAGQLLPAAILVSNACLFAALVLVYRYARLLGGERRAALLAVTLLCVLPHSLALSSGMSESTFLLLLVAAMYCLRRERYAAAAACAALLSATRAPGVFFALFALACAVRACGWRLLLTPWRAPERLLPVVLAPLGLFAFWTFCFVQTGDAFAQASSAKHGWEWSFVPPWQNLLLLLRGDDATMWMALGGILVLACIALLVRQRLFEDALFCLAAALLVLGSQGAVSTFRYWIVLFPAWIALARWLAPRPLAATTVVCAAAAANVFMVMAWTVLSPLAY